MDVSRDMRTREGSNTVAGCEISYSIIQRTNEEPSNVSVSIKTKFGGENIGNAQFYKDGKVYISLPGSAFINYTNVKEIINTILDDVISVFNESKTE
ncbi:hypothetical protein DW083_16510 [Parabacteroides sp. AF48-14]|jgi:hypothetical protein|uniref:hypothetical protein n=1 Tax=Parabacteroides sp. AF48-14 TaxID=2292052 RepID=UPI000EFEDA0A|nr:hypothetical protein [Parabacteroides sp. AF48-14]RHO68263.1 hypothetical protein DW083_16510 [Parabacteroides sp. AF48-14]